MTEVAAQAPRLTGGDSVLNFSLRIPAIVPLMLAGLIVRLAIAPLDGFGVDMGTFQGWSQRLAAEHPWNFYSDDFFSDYAPGYMYVLWLIGEINQIVGFTAEQYQFALKLPSIVADLAGAYLLYVMLKDKPTGMRLGATAIYLFLPITFFVGALWGQVDSILAFFLLLTVYYIDKNRPVAGAVAFTVGFLVKPQAIAALPFLAFWIIRDHPFQFREMSPISWLLAAAVTSVGAVLLCLFLLMVGVSEFYIYFVLPLAFSILVFLALGYDVLVSTTKHLWKRVTSNLATPIRLGARIPDTTIVACVLVPMGVLLLLVIPFFTYQPWHLISELYDSTNIPNYRVNSFWAYNFWNVGGLFEQGFRCDLASACDANAKANATEFLGIPTRYWSLGLFASALALTVFSLRKAKGTGFLALGTALSMLAFYMLLTRMHERYVFAFFLPFLLACALLNSRLLWGIFVITVAVHFLNLYHVYSYYEFFNPERQDQYPGFIRLDFLYEWLAKSDVFGFAVPLLGTLSTVQFLSIVFVAASATLLAAAFVLGERDSRTRAAAQ